MRDQANKTLDIYLQRVRDYSASMPESVLPPPSEQRETLASNDAARIGTPSDKSWAGWAISSFTNKLTSAEGEIQPTTKVQTEISDSARSSPVPRIHSKVTSPERKDLRRAVLERSTSDQVIPTSGQERGRTSESWTNDDDDDDPFGGFGDNKRSSSPAPVTVEDNGEEPDFAGLMAAKSKTKVKKPAAKSTTSKGSSTKGLPLRGSTTTKAKRIVAPAKEEEKKEKTTAEKVVKAEPPKVVEPKPVETQGQSQSQPQPQPENGVGDDDHDHGGNDDDDDDWGGFD